MVTPRSRDLSDRLIDDDVAIVDFSIGHARDGHHCGCKCDHASVASTPARPGGACQHTTSRDRRGRGASEYARSKQAWFGLTSRVLRSTLPKDIIMARRIRITDRLAPRKANHARTVLRLVLYGVLGVFFEVASFPIVRIGRTLPVLRYLFAFDSRPDSALQLDGPWHCALSTLFGQTSLWMVPIYAFAAYCIERLYGRVFRWPFPLRGLVYGIAILAIELVTGHLVRAITGYAIWQYHDSGQILEMTSLWVLPVWIFVGLSVELLYRELMDPDIRTTLETDFATSRLP